jgi:hypothetical protein
MMPATSESEKIRFLVWRCGDQVRKPEHYFDEIGDGDNDPKLMSLVTMLIEERSKPWNPNMVHDSKPADAIRSRDMADKERMKQPIWNCQKDIAAYLPPESGVTEHQLLQRLMTRLDGCQAKEALGDDWQGWWRDEDDGGDWDGTPGPGRRVPETA